MNSNMTINSQLLTTTTGRESQKWRSHGGLSAKEWEEDIGGKGTENKQHKWQVENRQKEVKNSIGNVEAKELICITHGHELKGGGMWVKAGAWGGGE